MLVYLNTLLGIIGSIFPVDTSVIEKADFLTCQLPTEAQVMTDATESLGLMDWSAVLDSTATFLGILASIFGGVSIILGVYYLRSLKEKHITETFSFWSQIHMRIIRLHGRLSVEKGLLSNMYPSGVRGKWEIICPQATELATFKESVEETLAFLQSATDQLPAYVGWSKDFSKFMQFLANVIQYDIEDSDGKFVEGTGKVINDLDAYWKDVCATMKRLQEGIEARQETVEKRICPESVFQKLCKREK